MKALSLADLTNFHSLAKERRILGISVRVRQIFLSESSFRTEDIGQ